MEAILIEFVAYTLCARPKKGVTQATLFYEVQWNKS